MAEVGSGAAKQALRIVVVDDNAMQLEAAASIAKTQFQRSHNVEMTMIYTGNGKAPEAEGGDKVVVYHTLNELNDFLQQNQPDLLITDFNMRNDKCAFNGDEVITTVKACFPHIYCVGISAQNNQNTMLEAGANSYFSKPITIPKIKNLIDAFNTFKNEPTNSPGLHGKPDPVGSFAAGVSARRQTSGGVPSQVGGP